MKQLFLLLVVVCFVSNAGYAQLMKLRLLDAGKRTPVEGAFITVDGKTIGISDSNGLFKANSLLIHPASKILLHHIEYKDTVLLLTDADTNTIEVLWGQNSEAELEEVVFSATSRSNQAIETSPLKIEVLGKEEVSEEASVKPGNVASLLSDVSGVQVQLSNPSSGNSNVRMQGLGGRYSQILRDGMPLFEGFAGGLGILSIPPLDLKQIDIIKGSASTLYGGGAIAGLINLISKVPTDKQELDVLGNISSLEEKNANVYAARRYKKMGYTFFAGVNSQPAKDVNKDGLSDVSKGGNVIVHPKLFIYPTSSSIISVGYTGIADNRIGGDMLRISDAGDSVHAYYEKNQSTRHSFTCQYDNFVKNNRLSVKGTYSIFNRTITTNNYQKVARQSNYYNEISYNVKLKKTNNVVGVCLQGDDYSDDNPHQADILWFHNLTAGIFAQSTIIISPKTTFEAGLRLDLPKNYAAKLMPRIAFFHKFNENWGTRWGVGTGYKLPQPFAAQDIDNVPLSVKWSGLSPEKSIGANAEVNYKCEWDKKTSLFVNQSFFYTGIENPIRYQYDSANYLSLINASKSVTTMGADLYAKLALHTWEIYLGFTYTLAKQHYDTVQPYIPLSPISRFATVISKKIAKKIDACIEGSYVGMQYLPTGNTTPSYVLLAAMCRYKAGEHITVMLNAENLFNYNMWKTQPVFSGSITMPTFNAVWSPIDGRVINISCRWQW